MQAVRFGIIGMEVRGSLYASILTGRQHPGQAMIPQPEGCVLAAICSRSDKTAEAEALGVTWFRDWRELANAITLSGWLGEAVPNPCDSARYDAELLQRMDEE